MILPKSEQTPFFENFYPLLCYVAVYSGLIAPASTLADFFKAPADVVIKSRDALFNDRHLLKYYVTDNARFLKPLKPGFVDEVKKGIFSDFIVLKEEKQFGVFIDRKTGRFYHVTGLTGPFSDILKYIPGYCKTALFNFGNHLVWDGIAIQKDKPVTASLVQTLLQQYDAALKAKKVIDLL
jgi:hypothetical protein